MRQKFLSESRVWSWAWCRSSIFRRKMEWFCIFKIDVFIRKNVEISAFSSDVLEEYSAMPGWWHLAGRWPGCSRGSRSGSASSASGSRPRINTESHPIIVVGDNNQTEPAGPCISCQKYQIKMKIFFDSSSFHVNGKCPPLPRRLCKVRQKSRSWHKAITMEST